MNNQTPEVDQQESKGNRRPLATREKAWAKKLAGLIVQTGVTPNQISFLSILPAVVGAWLLMRCGANVLTPTVLILVAVCIQLRLLCNMLDGMVAIEGGKKSPVGALYNEVPDRIADSLFIVALGYAVGLPWLGWLGALLAAKTAYIRVLGGSLGLEQDFRGPMAKQHRMFVMTLSCLLAAAELTILGSMHVLLVGAIVIAVGAGLTCLTRLRAMSKLLNQQAQ